MGAAVDEAMEEKDVSSLVEATALQLGTTSPEVGREAALRSETASPSRKLFTAPASAAPAVWEFGVDDESSRRRRCNGVSCLGDEDNERWLMEATDGDIEDDRVDVERGESVDVEHITFIGVFTACCRPPINRHALSLLSMSISSFLSVGAFPHVALK